MEGMAKDGSNATVKQKELLKKLKLQYKVWAITTSKNDIIRKMLDNLAPSPLSIKLTTTEIDKYFDLSSNDFAIQLKIGELQDTLREMTRYLRQVSHSYPEEAKTDFFYYSQVSVSDYCMLLAQEFAEDIGDDLTDSATVGYQHYKALEAALRSVVEEYRVFAAREMKDVYFSNTGSYPDTKDYRNCPHCHLTWYRVTACPNVTCGNIEAEKDIQKNFSSFFNFRFSWKKGEKPTITYETKQKVYNFVTARKNAVKGLGCGKSFDWMAQPPVDMTFFFSADSSDVIVTPDKIEKDAKKDIEEERKKIHVQLIN